jgi:hypothetical protein
VQEQHGGGEAMTRAEELRILERAFGVKRPRMPAWIRELAKTQKRKEVKRG